MFGAKHVVGPAARVRVRGRPAGEFLHARFGVDRNILPMPVAADDVPVPLSRDETTHAAAPGLPSGIRSVVELVGAVRFGNLRGRNQEMKQRGLYGGGA